MGATANDVNAVESYLDWVEARNAGSPYANCTFEEWCGHREIPPLYLIDFYHKFYKEKYDDWDVEHKYSYKRIMEKVGYWRKANHIHNWFVENVQDGVDDCRYHREITEEDLRALYLACNEILRTAVVDRETSKVTIDISVAESLLPSQDGFFFGGTDYDEYYVKDIQKTIEIIRKVMDTTDFKTQMIYYLASW